MELYCWYREYRSTDGAMSEVIGIESTGALMELCQRLLLQFIQDWGLGVSLLSNKEIFI